MTLSTPDDLFDAQARDLHAQAIGQVPPRTLHRLRVRRATVAPARPVRRALAWPMAGACAALVAVAALILPPEGGVPSPQGTTRQVAAEPAATADDGDAYAALDEDPDLYLWLASRDAQPLAME